MREAFENSKLENQAPSDYPIDTHWEIWQAAWKARGEHDAEMVDNLQEGMTNVSLISQNISRLIRNDATEHTDG